MLAHPISGTIPHHFFRESSITMAVCAICGKAAVSGSNVSHSKVHTKRRFRPNLQRARVDGKRVLICMRCKRTLAKTAA